jgi:hypothetical protein
MKSLVVLVIVIAVISMMGSMIAIGIMSLFSLFVMSDIGVIFLIIFCDDNDTHGGFDDCM